MQVVVQTSAACPGCGATMSKFAAADGVLAVCAGCGGMWVDNTAARWVLLNLLSPEARTFVKTFVSRGSPAEQSPYRASDRGSKTCPVCRHDLVATTMKDPIVVVDVCPQDGTFFDKGELSTIVSTLEVRALQGEVDDVADAATAQWDEHTETWTRGSHYGASSAIAGLLYGGPAHGLWR